MTYIYLGRLFKNRSNENISPTIKNPLNKIGKNGNSFFFKKILFKFL